MQVLLLQLSDIHLRSVEDRVLTRTEKIKLACHSAAPNAVACVIILSGDIAFSGLAAQYEAAYKFLVEFRDSLLELPSIAEVEFAAVPGNHDCDFTGESDIRQYMLKDVNAFYESGITPGSDRLKAVLEVQRNFFAFEARLTNGKEVSPDQRLNYGRAVKFRNYTLRFQCYNTAWLSRKHEEQAKLFFPAEAIEPVPSDASVCISIFHHPYNWLDANNYRVLREEVEQSSDLVFTGHEHLPGGSAVERFSGQHLHYVEGAALQAEQGSVESGFNCLVLDFETGEQRLDQFSWNGAEYVSRGQKTWSKIVKNPARERFLFKLNPSDVQKLTDPGAAFNHKRKRSLRLSDLYVYPDLHIASVERFVKESRKPRTINSREVLDYFRENSGILITGPDDSGKTALLKTLFMEFSSDFVPVLVSGKDLAGKMSEHRFHRLIATTVERQYDAESVDRYFRLDPARRVLLVDDYHQANLARSSEFRLIEFAKNMFGHVVFAADDLYGIRIMAGKDAENDPFKDFETCAIKEFGHRLRGLLINKWLSLGRESASDLILIDQETRKTEKVITSLLGKNVVPSYPINVLSLLHTMESAQPHATADASFGSLYEALIKENLRFASGDALDDAELKLTYTSVIAYALFEKEQQSLSEADLRGVHEEYVKLFDVSPNMKQVLSDLLEANVLKFEMGDYSFKYNHVYYYCVSKYFERGLKRRDGRANELRAKIEYMADRLHSEELANIVLFYLYLTQDWDLTQRILANANRVYATREPCNLKEDVEFVNKIFKEPPKMLIEDTDIEKHREEHRRKMDEAEESGAPPPSLDAKLAYQEDLADIYKINIAFKTMQVLGQVLRSSAAFLEGDVKLQILESVYMLGLRTLRAMLGVAEQNINEIRLYLASLIRERAHFMDRQLSDPELLKITDEGVIWLTHACSFGCIKKVSFAVGHHHLADSYERVLARYGNYTSVRMIDLAIKLDHFSTVPMGEVTRLRDSVVGNMFGYSLLRQFVADFLYLYRTDIRTSQRLGELFKIEGATSPKFLLPDSKRN